MILRKPRSAYLLTAAILVLTFLYLENAAAQSKNARLLPLNPGLTLQEWEPRVIDGEAIKFADVPLDIPGLGRMPGDLNIQIAGIIIPKDPVARSGFRQYMRGQLIRCTLTGETENNRYIGNCFYHNIFWHDLGEALLRLGYARALPSFRNSLYEKAQRAACEDGYGVWERPAPKTVEEYERRLIETPAECNF